MRGSSTTSGVRCHGRPRRRVAVPRCPGRSWLLVTLSVFLIALSVFLIASCSNGTRSAPFAAATTTTAAVPGPSPLPTPVVSATSRAALARVSVLTALGDSVPYGTACSCSPYPQLAAADVGRISGHAVEAFNESVPGFRSSDVLRQLGSDRSAIADVQRADAVTIEIGANDIAYSTACGTDASCYESSLPQVAANVTAIVSRVRQLATGRHVTVVLLDYWSVWLGGQYAQARGPAYVGAASSLTHAFGAAMQSIALTTDSVYVDLRTAFRGPDDDRDDTNLLASDGDHPDAEGQERIANGVVQALAKISTASAGRQGTIPMRATGSAGAARRWRARSSECSKTLRISRGSMSSSNPNVCADRYEASIS